MIYTDEEKRSFIISRISEYLNTLDSFDKVKIFIKGVTPEKIKAKLKEAYEKASLENSVVVENAQDKKVADEAMITEIDGF